MTEKKREAMPARPKRGRREVFTVAQVAEALRSEAGIISLAAARLRTSRQIVYGYLERHPELEDVRRETEEETLDLAQGKLIQNISSGNMTAIIFYLKTKGRSRGFIERHEHSGPGGAPIPHIDLSKLTDEQLAQYRALVASAA
jgi:hypothetical protein